MKTSFRHTVAGIAKTVLHPSQSIEDAIGSGALMDNVVRELMEQTGGRGPIVQSYLKLIQMNSTEILNRSIANAAGKGYVQSLARKLEKNPGNTVAARELRRLNVDPEELASNKYVLSKLDLDKAGQTVANKTQVRSSVLDMPPGWKAPWVKLISQFRTFTYKIPRGSRMNWGNSYSGHWTTRQSSNGQRNNSRNG